MFAILATGGQANLVLLNRNRCDIKLCHSTVLNKAVTGHGLLDVLCLGTGHTFCFNFQQINIQLTLNFQLNQSKAYVTDISENSGHELFYNISALCSHALTN